MPKLIATSALLASLAVLPSLAGAQEGDVLAAEAVTPDTPAPAWTPPPPAEAQAVPEAPPQQTPVPPGQWVYTAQYGWIWMPYADAYTSVPRDGWGTPYAYVYAPAYAGWTWVTAPWIWGVGPWPAFGVWGPARFAWYGHGWWRSPARWHDAPARWGWYPGGGWRAPHRGGAVVGPRVSPFRGGAVVRGAIGGGHGGGRGGGHGSRGGHGR